MCSTRNAGLVRSIGAAHVVDYTREDFTGGRVRHDVILDNVSSLPLSRLARRWPRRGRSWSTAAVARPAATAAPTPA